MTTEVNKGVTAVLPFKVRNAAGTLANATSLPTIKRIMVNGTLTVVAGALIEQQQDATPANITGRYQIKVPTADLASGVQVQVQIEAVIDGVTLDGDIEFSVVNTTENRPRIETI